MAVPAQVIERPVTVPETQVRTTSRGFHARRRRRQRIVHWTIFGVLVVIAAIFIFPFFWVFSSSLQTTLEANSLPLTWWPAIPQWHNYVVAWGELDFTRFLLQTIYVMVLSTVGEVLSASLCAYGFARIKFPGRDAWFYGVLASIMLPGTVTLIPLFIIFKDFGWLNTYYPLWVPAFLGGGAFNIFLMRQFMLSIPRELEESARLDGAGHLTIFRRIVLPLVRPVLAVATWTAALASWGNFFLPLIILTSERKWTLALGLYGLGIETIMGYADQLLMAMTVVTMIPVIIGFFFLQRWLIEGVNLTGVAR